MSDYENLWEYTQKCEAHIKQLEAELARVKGDEKKAFWWSAEFTKTVHSNKIQAAWEDYLNHKQGE